MLRLLQQAPGRVLTYRLPYPVRWLNRQRILIFSPRLPQRVLMPSANVLVDAASHDRSSSDEVQYSTVPLRTP